MKMSRFKFTILLTFVSFQIQSQSISWKPPLLPISINYDFNEGLSIEGTGSIATPIGVFRASAEIYPVKKKNNVSDRVKTSNSSTQVEIQYRDRIKYVDKIKYVDRVEYVDKIKYIDRIEYVEKYVEVPVYTEVIKEVYIKEKEFLLIIRDKISGFDYAVVISGVSEFMATLNGETQIMATEGQIIIDITGNTKSSISFNGRIINNPETMSDKIFKLCYQYNELSESNTFLFNKDVSIKEFNSLLDKYQVRYNKEDVIAISKIRNLPNKSNCSSCKGLYNKLSKFHLLIFTDKGIYWSPITISSSKSIRSNRSFTPWQEFKLFDIKKVDNCCLSIEGYEKFSAGYIGASASMGSHKWELFFEDLNTILND